MIKLTVNNYCFYLLFLYLFFISFLNFTPIYLVSAVLMIGFTFIKVLSSRKIVGSGYFIFQLIFITYCSMYLIFGITIDETYTKTMLKTVILNLVINFAIFNIIEKEKNIKQIMKAMICIAIFSGLYAIIYSLGSGITLSDRLMHGLPKPFSDKTYTAMEFASWATYASTFCVYFFNTSKNKKYLFLLPFFLIIVLWCGSRKWIVFYLFSTFFTYLYCSKNKSLNRKISAITIGLVILVVIFFMVISFKPLYDAIGSRIIGFFEKTDSSSNYRDKVGQLAYSYIIKKPFIGYGLNTFRLISFQNGYALNWCENNYLELLFSGGIPLLVIYYLYIFYMIFNFFKYRKLNDMFILFLIILVSMVSLDGISMSYQGRLETYILTISAALLRFGKKGDNLNEGVCNNA